MGDCYFSSGMTAFEDEGSASVFSGGFALGQSLFIRVKHIGGKDIAYMKRDFLNTSEFDDYDFWVAYYKDEAPEDIRYMIWQCTSKGKLYGHSGTHIDVNIYGGDNTHFSKLLRQYHTK